MSADWSYQLPGFRAATGYSAIALSPSAQSCAVADRMGNLTVFRRDGDKWRRLDVRERDVTSVAFANELLIVGDRYGSLKIIELSEQTIVSSFHVHLNAVAGIVVGREGATCATWSYDGTIKAVDIFSGRILWTRDLLVQSATSSQRGLLCGASDVIVTLSEFDGRILDSLSIDGDVLVATEVSKNSIAFIVEEVGNLGGELFWLRVGDQSPTSLSTGATCLALDGRGGCLVGLSDGHIGWLSETQFQVLDAWRPHFDRVNAISVANEGAFASSSRDGRIGLWADRNGRVLGSVEQLGTWAGQVIGAATSSNHEVVALANGDLVALRLRDGVPEWRASLGGPIIGLHCDGSYTLGLGSGGNVRVFDATGATVYSEDAPDEVRCGALHGNRGLLVTSEKECGEFEWRTHKVTEYRSLDVPVARIAMADSRVLAADDENIFDLLRDAEVGFRSRRVATLPLTAQPIIGLWMLSDFDCIVIGGDVGILQVFVIEIQSGRSSKIAEIIVEDSSFQCVDALIDQGRLVIAAAAERSVFGATLDIRAKSVGTYVFDKEGNEEPDEFGIVMSLNVIKGGSVISCFENGVVKRHDCVELNSMISSSTPRS